MTLYRRWIIGGDDCIDHFGIDDLIYLKQEAQGRVDNKRRRIGYNNSSIIVTDIEIGLE